MRAAFSVGRAIASSIELVCRLCVPPSTPASASIAVRAILTSGCCAVSETPAVWVWNRIIIERSKQKNFQLILITHDEEFISTMKKELASAEGGFSTPEYYFRVYRELVGDGSAKYVSKIERVAWAL